MGHRDNIVHNISQSIFLILATKEVLEFFKLKHRMNRHAVGGGIWPISLADPTTSSQRRWHWMNRWSMKENVGCSIRSIWSIVWTWKVTASCIGPTEAMQSETIGWSDGATFTNGCATATWREWAFYTPSTHLFKCPRVCWSLEECKRHWDHIHVIIVLKCSSKNFAHA
jgi:hypothetical protein